MRLKHERSTGKVKPAELTKNRMPTTPVRRCATALILFTACASHSGEKAASDGFGLSSTASGWVFTTGPITVQPGEEKYMCYAAIIGEDLSISRFSSSRNPLVHHFLFVETEALEANGLKECNVLFRPTWAPMYAATTADSVVDIPEGAAKEVPKGKQVLLQAHLVNTTSEPLTRSVEVSMERSPLKNPEKVGIMLFGAANINLPPQQKTSVESRCTVSRDVRLYAVLPHMHRLGTRLELDFGADDASQKQAYVRDPFTFDDQYFDKLTLTIPGGSVVHTHCSFENDTDQTVTFGESSKDEMCFAVGFNVGGADLELCTEPVSSDGGVPRAADAGACGETSTSNGIGRFCTAGGSECGNGSLLCSADLLNTKTGLCFQAGCVSNADCSGTTCCTLPVVGKVANVCIPEGCRPDFCIPIANQTP